MASKLTEMTLNELQDEVLQHPDDCDCKYCRAFDILYDATHAIERIDQLAREAEGEEED